VRTRIGPLRDTRLAPGEWRPLTTDEIRELERSVSTTAPRPADGGAGEPQADR